MNKGTKNILQTYKDNIKQVHHQRRASHLPDSSTNILNKQINIGKKIGMIIRNPSSEMKKSNQKENIPIFGCEGKIRVNDQVMMKVKHSQLVNKHTFKEQQKVQKQSKAVCNLPIRNTRSVSNHYQERYNLLVDDYQKKKQKISHQIEKVRSNKPSKNSLFFEIDHNNLQTPKFGSGFKKEIIKKLSVNKIGTNNVDFSAFIKAIKKQMELDQALRLTKHFINKENEDKIKDILKKQYKMQENLTVIQSDEFDPFAQTESKNAEFIASDLFKNHIAAEQYWNKHILHNFQQSLLTSLFQRLKARPQNPVNLKDFVRQIGILTHNQRYLRNRDLFRIFKRLQPLNKDNFLEILRCKK